MSQNPVLPLVVEPEDLAKHLNNDQILIVDICNPQLYAQAHVPGAVNISAHRMVSGIQPATGKLPAVEQLNTLFSELGYTGNEHIVVYDDEGGGWAGRFIWTLDMIGHKGGYSYLNGGAHSWLKEGLPTENKANSRQATDVELTIDTQPLATKEQIIETLNDDSVVIWDARSPEEHAGVRVLAQKAGRIPGAINFEWTQAMDHNRNLRIRTDLNDVLPELGLTKDKTVITHCQTHHRSGFTYLVGKVLGYDIKAYDGSWSEWGNSPETPVEVQATCG